VGGGHPQARACENAIRVLYFLPAFEIGGAERSVYNLLAHHRPPFQPALLTFRKAAPFWGELSCPIYILEDLGISESMIRGIFLHKHVPHALFAARQLSRLIRAERFDVAVGVLHISALLLALAKDCFRLHVPIVANLRGDATAYFKSEVSSAVRRVMEKALLRYLCRRANAVVVPSLGVGSDLVKQYRVPEAKVYTVYNGLDLDEIRRRSGQHATLPWPKDNVPTILGVGRLDSQKSFHILVEAFALLRKRFPARLVLLGEGVERARLERLASELGIGDDVLLPGFMENPFAAMRAASVFALSSMYEGFGNVIVEAMALGCPVVSTDCPSGPGEIIGNGVSGLLVPTGDPRSLSEALCRVLMDDKLRQQLIEGGLRRAEDLRIANTVEGYERVYRALAPNHHN
jgi:glycosyltransferase involved in cell wall biosynthesis